MTDYFEPSWWEVLRPWTKITTLCPVCKRVRRVINIHITNDNTLLWLSCRHKKVIDITNADALHAQSAAKDVYIDALTKV